MSEDSLLQRINAAMQAAIPQRDDRVQTFYNMQQYHLGWRNKDLQPAQEDQGKLIRPRLCLLACAIVGGTVEDAIPLASAIQLLHDFTLIHDDIEDRSPTRRGRETIWNLWGEAQAINAGDGLFTIAQLELLRLIDVGVDPQTVVEIAKQFNQTILRICEGQYLDISFESRLDITEADYFAMISRKTAALIAASTGLGAIIGGGDQEQTKALFDYGEALGLTFQIEDDILGIWGQEAITGKPDAHDIWGRKKSLPIIHALNHAEQHQQTTLRTIYQKDSLDPHDIEIVLDILEQAGSKGYTSGVARFYHEQAIAALSQLETQQSSGLHELQNITKKLLGRAK